jgi:hypothetical protein
MTKQLSALLSLNVLLVLNVFAQTPIVISKSPQKVPYGKKWILPTNQNILVEVSDGSLSSGTKCNADLYSNPRILSALVEGEYGRPTEIYGILFKELNKVHYTNDATYSIVPVALVDTKFSLSELANTPLEKVGKKQIIFYPGQKIYASDCLESIQVLEYTLDPTEMIESNKKEKEEKMGAGQRKKDEDDQNKKFWNDWKNEVHQKNTEDSLERVRLTTYPRVLIRYNSYNLEYIVKKNKNGKVKINQIGSTREFCDECDSKIPQFMDKQNQGSYHLLLKINPVKIAVSSGVSKEEKQIELDGAISPYVEK